ncbi:MAG TPA: hypothetical protein PKY30_15870, partial [Myxococcota bacterium]|nr:hypothetical protein [Myxococcota bacterium]
DLSLAATEGATAFVYAGTGPGSSTVEGGVQVDLANAVPLGQLPLPQGLACASLPLPPELAGSAWVQVSFDQDGGAVNGRVINLFGVEPEDSGSPGPNTDDSADDVSAKDGEEVAACGGCSSSSSSPFALALLLPLLRRRGVHTV